MEFEGGCYCGAVRYRAKGDPLFKGQCHCRECQYIAGGSPNMLMAVPEAGFTYTGKQPKQFQRTDIDDAVTREFCEECGTHILAKSARMPGALMLKVGTLDDPAGYGMPNMAIFTVDQQSFHTIPDGVATFERLPG